MTKSVLLRRRRPGRGFGLGGASFSVSIGSGPFTTGTELTATVSGLEGGETVTYQWQDDGVNITGATSSTYTAAIGTDSVADESAISVQITVDGGDPINSASRTITRVAPTTTGLLVAQTFTKDTGDQTYDASVGFSGDDITYSEDTPGISIGSTSGQVIFNTNVLAEQSGSLFEITATNSGGSVSDNLPFTIEAAVAPELTAFTFDTSVQPNELESLSITGTWTSVKWQLDGAAGYASTAAMDAATGSADATGTFTSLPATFDFTGITSGDYNLHMYAIGPGGTQAGAPQSVPVTVDNIAPVLSTVTAVDAGGANITWGATTTEGIGVIYAAARLSTDPQLSEDNIRLGTGNAVATSTDATPTADANNGGNLSVGAAGTYVVDAYHDDGFGNKSGVVSSASVVVATYTQAIMDNNDVARIDFVRPLPSSQSLATVSFWMVDNNPSGNAFQSAISASGVAFLRTGGTPGYYILVIDSAGTTVIDISNNTQLISTTSGAPTHVVLHVDISGSGACDVYIDGVLTSFSVSAMGAGNGELRFDQLLAVPQNATFDMQIADFLVSYGELIPVADLYNGGTPPTFGTKAFGASIGSPQLALGGDMTAADWNAGNVIEGAAGSVTTGWTLVP